MNFDTRNNSALMKRAEQLRRWEESDTNREPTVPKNERGRKIKFSLGCVFLAACIAGDKDEVLRLLESGADINTANVDGLTALHQACIDDNLEMVEFLVGNGADINRQDNEGWTPLHATASCGFVSIARYLIENGADLAAINSDGELSIDLASTNAMADFLQTIYDENGIDCDQARQCEEQIMLSDAKKWLRSDASEADKPHPKTGATALHVAAAKGYTKVLSLLLAGRANVDKQDNDGWTPMHAAAHWGQKESIQMLIDAMADIDVKNYAGQTPLDVAEPSIVKFLEDIKANNKRFKRRPTSQIRISDTIENHIEAPAKMIRVEVKADSKDTVNDEDGTDVLEKIVENDGSDSDITDSTESSHSTSISDNLEDKPKPPSESVTPAPADNNTGVDEDAPWRRNSSLRSRTQVESPTKTQVPEKDAKSTDSEVILRRTQSFENDQKFYQKYHELRARIKANSCPILPATQQTGVLGAVNPPNNYSVQRSASLKDHKNLRKATVSLPVSPSTPSTPPNTGQVRSVDNEIESESDRSDTASIGKSKSNDSGSFRSKMSPGNIFKNFFKSFVPPVRDEESETQRKAHAKRVRETRRSTQGVTLDEIKSAEELVKKKNLNNNNNNPNTEVPNTTETSSITHSTSATPSDSAMLNDRVPSTTATITNTEVGFKPIDPAPSGATVRSTGDEITATFTMTMPMISLKDRDRTSGSCASDQLISDSSQNSVTYTLPTSQHSPTGNSPSTLTPSSDSELTSVCKRSSNETQNSTDNTAGHVSATIVPNSVYEKTDADTKAEGSAQAPLSIILTSDSQSTSNVDSNKSDLSSPLEEAVVLRNTNDTKEKRSLFDIDNANSLTLAEKLRNEANKYNESLSQSSADGLRSASADENMESLSGRRTDSTPSSPLHMSAAERRPSWRLKFDSGNKFKLEDASTGAAIASNNSTIITSAPAVIAAANLSSISQRRNNANTSIPATQSQSQRPISAPAITTTPAGNDNSNDRTKEPPNEVTLSLRKNRTAEDKENDKENDSRSAQATQAVIQRRRRPKRRSTGVVHVDMDDIDPDRQDSPAENDEKETSTMYNGNQSYSRPFSGGYYPNPTSNYQSPYLANHYGSRENLYNHSSRNGFYPSGNYPNSSRHQPRTQNTISHKTLGSYDKRYGANTYASDRYVSPYSSYDNGVTTAVLSLAITPKTYTPSSSSISNSKPKSSSNQSLNSYQLSKPNKVSTGTNTPPITVNRSSSLREQERKGRSRTRSRAVAARSTSASSEKSEGYESGSERLSRSRLGSSSSLSGEQNDSKSKADTTENGEIIDYKALWEAVKLENDQLKQELKKKDDDLATAKAAVERFANATTKNSLSELEKRERRAMERKLSEMEEELKHLDVLKAENQRLKEENGALIRVISKLSK